MPPRAQTLLEREPSGATAPMVFAQAAQQSISPGRFSARLAMLALTTAFIGGGNYRIDVAPVSSGGTFRLRIDALIPTDIRGDELEQCQPFINPIRTILKHAADRRGIDAQRVEVSRFTDPEESTEELVVTQYVNLPAEGALAYWDEVGAEVQRWISSLPPRDAELATRHIAVNIRWRDAESSRL
jgi:hypothetical protein